jgi:acyl-CoA thioester hydrolase
MNSPRRKKGGYFPVDPTAPEPLVVRVEERIRFSDVDPMGVMWHGRFAHLFEQANEELGLVAGMTYADFHREKIAAPIVQLHIDYFAPLMLGEKATITGKMIWNEGARIDVEYEVRGHGGKLVATGYTVQMFVDSTGTPLMASPALQENCRQKWRAGQCGQETKSI